jgi:hypothetical protein
MTAALWVAYVLLVALCWIGGVRLLRIALRTQEVTEWGLGVALLCTGGIGYPLIFLRSLLPLSPEASGTSFAIGLAALSLGSIALYVFNWRLFRPHSVAAALLSSAGSFVIAWSFLAELLTIGFVWDRDPFWIALGGGARWLPYVWGSLEALRLARASAPTDPEAARRFLLYGSSLAGIAAIFGVGLVSAFAGDGASHPRGIIALGALGGIPSALALWFAIHSPAASAPPASSSSVRRT